MSTSGGAQPGSTDDTRLEGARPHPRKSAPHPPRFPGDPGPLAGRDPAQPTRPLPRLSEPDTRAFWEATRSGLLTYQVCRRCAGIVFYPRRHCPHCTGTGLEERTSAGRGTVYAYTVIRQHGHPFFRGRIPYVLALVDLDEGFRMLSEIAGAAPDEVHVGQRVTLAWEDHGEVRVPLFRPDGP